jgi:hypothetical protein
MMWLSLNYISFLFWLAGLGSELFPYIYRWGWFCFHWCTSLLAPSGWHLWGQSTGETLFVFFLFCYFGLLTAPVISDDFCHCLLIVIWFPIFLTGNYEAHDFVLQGCCRGIFPFSTANRVTFLNIGNSDIIFWPLPKHFLRMKMEAL